MEYKIIKFDDNEYPEKLRIIKEPPKRLYVNGNIKLLKEEGIGIIGTRNITSYGVKMATRFSTEVALRNIPIISGMAIGCDTIAHQMALKYSCPTIAVLGTGFNNIYPKENIELYKEILNSNGLVITEIEPNGIYDSQNFAKRNRIISALSTAILVIEAGYRSGTGVTVKYAREQNKRVFALPGRLDSKYGIGVNRFIKEGATFVIQIEDVLESYPQFANKKRKTRLKIKKEYKEIYKLIKEDFNTIDEISKQIPQKTIREIANLLTMMELEDLIVKDFGNGYLIKEDNE